MVPVPLSAGSEPAIRLASYFDMDIEDSKQHPWLEYSVWQDQEWVRIYTAGQPQRWHHGETVPDLPDNSFREWQRVTALVSTVRHGPSATGSIRDTSAFCLEWSPSQLIIRMINLLVKFGIPMPYATPFSHGDRSTASQLASVLYGDTRNAQRGDLSLPSSERFRAVSRSPRRGGFFGQR